MITEIDLYRKKVSIPPLGILHYLQADVFIAERFKLPYGLSKLIRMLGPLLEGRRPYRCSQVVDLTCVAVGSILGRRIIRPVRAALIKVIVVVAITNEIAVLRVHSIVDSISAVAFCGRRVTTILIAIVALIIVCRLLYVRIELGIVGIFVERILETSASWCVNKLSRPAARVGLKEYDRR